jgi:hypothetical protein
MTDSKNSSRDNPKFFGPPVNGQVTETQVAAALLFPWGNQWAEFLTSVMNANAETAIAMLRMYKTQLENPFNFVAKAHHRAWENFYKSKGESPGGAIYQQLKFLFSGSGSVPPEMQGAVKDLLRGDQAVQLAKALGDVIPGAGVLYEGQYNHKFLTESDAGEIVTADIDAIVKQFAGEDPNQKFPRIVITSSHAQGETLDDVTKITRGIESLIHHSQGETTPISAMRGQVKNLKQPIILYACDTQKNPFLNAVELMERLDELEEISRTGEADKFKKASPSARRIARLFLKCVVTEPEKIDVNDARPLKIPLQLKANAEHIAQHFQLIGYSKGGNVVSDAMRCLIDELTAKDEQGQHLVRFAEGTELDKLLLPDARIRNLVRNIACASFAAIELPMAQQYKNHGVRRFAVNNIYDKVADHKPYASSAGDRKIDIEGSPELLGHDPAAALGTRDARGYFLKDERVARRLKEWFAPMFGKAAISSIAFEDSRIPPNSNAILIGTAPGTPDELLMQYKETIIKAMKNARLTGVTLETTSNQNGRAFILKCREKIASDPQAIKKLQAGFEALIQPEIKGLVIAQDILDTTIRTRRDKINQKIR